MQSKPLGLSLLPVDGVKTFYKPKGNWWVEDPRATIGRDNVTSMKANPRTKNHQFLVFIFFKFPSFLLNL